MVTFTGFLRGKELARTFESCDVFVFPSATDTLGRAVAEAQASGFPAVVCGIGGPRECIRPGVSGFVVDPEDDEEFFARVEELVEDPAKRERMGREAREFAEGLDWQAVLEGLFSLYAQVASLQDRGPTPTAGQGDYPTRSPLPEHRFPPEPHLLHGTVPRPAALGEGSPSVCPELLQTASSQAVIPIR